MSASRTVNQLPCRKCGLVPFADRQEWARDKERQDIGYAFASDRAMPTYCMTCGRYQGLWLTDAFWAAWDAQKTDGQRSVNQKSVEES